MWSRTGLHEWRHPKGWVIQRMWSSTKGKRDFFPCYLDVSSYHAGNNFTSAASLKGAKSAFEVFPDAQA